ncbi:MAG TPA: hypothetical protein VFL27_01005 [Candidatus Dormibacteraeota bacterium]|nr:hypothetical protein [Candidatus Dormibacteraeota bacterium]
MPHVSARVFPGAVMIAVALVMLSALSVYAKSDPDNPNGSHDGLVDNPGHHYGQYKHQTPSPVPSPLPTPAPTQAPATPAPAVTPPAAVRPNPQSQPQPSSRIPDLPVSLPVKPSGQISVAEPRPAGDGLWWLLLLILPLLLAIWVLVVTRLVVTALRRLRRDKAVPQVMPAPA